MHPRSVMTRHYEHWPAHHYFFCRGGVMLGSNPGMLMVTLILLGGPFSVWLIFVALPLNQLPVLVTGSALLAATLYFLTRAALTDPGILPRCTPPPAEELPEPPSHLHNADGSDLYYCDTFESQTLTSRVRAASTAPSRSTLTARSSVLSVRQLQSVPSPSHKALSSMRRLRESIRSPLSLGW